MSISLITYYFGLEQLCKCILLSLVMTDLLLFKNHKEYIEEIDTWKTIKNCMTLKPRLIK